MLKSYLVEFHGSIVVEAESKEEAEQRFGEEEAGVIADSAAVTDVYQFEQ